VQEIQLPCEFDAVCTDHQLMSDAEGARSLRVEAEAARGKISSEALAMIARAQSTTWEQELAAKRRVASLVRAIDDIFKSFDVIVGASCGIVAPIGLGSTGSSDFIKLWTTFGLPQVNIPLPRESGACPVGLQAVGAIRNDAVLLRVAERIAALLDPPLDYRRPQELVP
jgi:Asp-tRNA(Asn)/Glu-tRNA(Gln) amidotransferase A subunit family amidase